MKIQEILLTIAKLGEKVENDLAELLREPSLKMEWGYDSSHYRKYREIKEALEDIKSSAMNCRFLLENQLGSEEEALHKISKGDL